MIRALLTSDRHATSSANPRLSSCASGHSHRSRLEVSEPTDPSEREADRTAHEVMNGRLPETSLPTAYGSQPFVQRKCSCGEAGSQGEECKECKNKEQNKIQRWADGPSPKRSVSPAVHREESYSGRPLEANVRSFFEPRFGQDFSKVRIHTDSESARSASSLQAKAYTIGSNIVFGKNHYRPSAESGRRLLAHELAHVVQNNRTGRPAKISRFKVEDCDAGNPMETSQSVKDAHTRGMNMLKTANATVNSSPTTSVVQAASKHFNLAVPPTSDKDKINWARARRALSTMTKADSDATYECEPKQNWWNGGCISGNIAVSLFNIHLCPLWWTRHTNADERAAILIHEWGHKWGAGVNRIFESYRFDKDYKNMPAEKRIKLPDAYMSFVFEVATGNAPSF
jgi:Domain of unknown function (DUF4157)